MDIKAQRLEILQQVENGEITLEAASRWLAALDRVHSKNGAHPQGDRNSPDGLINPQASFTGDANPEAGSAHSAALITPPLVKVTEPIQTDPVEPVQPVGNGDDARPPFWRGWWMIAFFPGVLLLVAAVNWMVQGYLAAGLSWGFWLSFIPFTIGVLLIWLGWEVRIARWFHLRVTQHNKPGAHEIMISFPLPSGLVSWGVRRFGHFAGPIRGKDMQGILGELDQAVATDGPMHIFVDNKDGDKVEIWIEGPRAK